ncbi:ubiquitin carboxyl-terminal hydrolase 2 [Aulographum hederae CBS 113979]|uniref:Ubiquitin carboxyl-terminal hydrolase n=1 Tax=Aulographum hederae CBS 113979 TaxID=1176131 RepID=A0A6G1GMM9_9PEZI|nr:ubiquitin carboxyl-terminal hydrolase 2 [Aulographum hederae CBS 113979]
MLDSPKVTKSKPIMATSPIAIVSYGCEHLQSLLKENRKMTMQQYVLLVQTVNDRHSLLLHTYKEHVAADGRPVSSLTPTYLCLQCPNVFTEEGRDKHWESKSHGFSVESRNGYLYCQNCEDFVYDPTLETLRMRGGRKKRKLDDYLNSSGDDSRLMAANSTFVPCRANGLRGLYNMGQTCFMSVVLQSLLHNPFVKSFYLSEGHRASECEKESCTSCAFDEIFTEFHSVEKTEGFGAVNMLIGSWMGAQALAGYQQQDAHEYMQFILNALHSENSNESDAYSDDCPCIIHSTFYGKLQSTVTCNKCRNVTTALDPMMDLSVDLRNQVEKKEREQNKLKKDKPEGGKAGAKKKQDMDVDIRDCLERFTSKEALGATEYTCQNCDATQQKVTKQLSLQVLPPVLAIHLKRFEHSKSNSTKIEMRVNFPLQLDLFPYTSRARADQANSPHKGAYSSLNTAGPSQKIMYELSSVVVHQGDINGGHYTSYSREGMDWFMFDDSRVTLATEAEVLNCQAYLLFYVVEKLEVGPAPGVSTPKE